jgi:polyhydroxyalkanoate synthesis regulator phasin
MNKDLERLLYLDCKHQAIDDYATGLTYNELEEYNTLKSKLESQLEDGQNARDSTMISDLTDEVTKLEQQIKELQEKKL